MTRLTVQQRRKLNERLRLYPVRCRACQQSTDLTYTVGEAAIVCASCAATSQPADHGLVWHAGGPGRHSYWTTTTGDER